jgi:uncharacterized protein (TIGR00730 family)
MDRIGVFCGSSPGLRPAYADAARALGRTLAARRLGLVYGGSAIGLMGLLADAVLDGGGEVIGVIPQALLDREIGHRGLTELHVVASMHERKARMAELADAFVALPGGMGTLEELTEVLTWAQLGLHAKPCGLLDVEGYFASLVGFFDHAVEEGFLRREHRGMLAVEREANALLERFEEYRAPRVTKWIGPGAT